MKAETIGLFQPILSVRSTFAYPWQPSGLTMRTVSKTLVYAVLFCLLLSSLGGTRRLFPRGNKDHRLGRDRHSLVARIRRCREENLAHHPVRPCIDVLLPPDEEDGDRDRLHAKDAGERLSASYQNPVLPFHFSAFGTRPRPTHVPRHQTLCLLLI